VACRATTDKRALIRFVRVADKNPAEYAAERTSHKEAPSHQKNYSRQVQLDVSGRKAGRGAYLCSEKSCFEKVRKNKALERALRCSIAAEEYDQLAREYEQLVCESKSPSAAELARVGTVING